MMHSAVIASACGLILILLSARVIALRRRFRISVGHQNNGELERAMRVQANFTEYAPLFLVLLALAEHQGLASWGIDVLGAVFLGGRVLHFFGFRDSEAPGALRVMGMALTFTAIAAVSLVTPIRLLAAA